MRRDEEVLRFFIPFLLSKGYEIMMTETPQAPEYVSTLPFFAGEADTLVIHCSQHNFQMQIDDFMHTHLACASFDRMAIPGGAEFFRSPIDMPKFMWSGKKWSDFLIINHRITQLVLIGHAGCAWNGAIMRLSDAEKLTRHTCDSLRQICELMRRASPHISVAAYFAALNSAYAVEFSLIA